MKETIYTIPINEAFEVKGGCPICRMYNQLDKNETERITGAAMMEPDVRIETNKSGFCKRHYDALRDTGKALPTALLLESHLDTLQKLFSYTAPGRKENVMASMLKIQNNDCYICSRVNRFFGMETDNLFLMLDDPTFREKFDAAEYFCLPHLELLIRMGTHYMKKGEYERFAKGLFEKESRYFKTLKHDVSDFCKTFDHRFSDGDFPNAFGSTERAVKALKGE